MKTILKSLTVVVLGVGLAGSARAGEMFGKKCASCHGADGKAKTTMGQKLKVKDLTDAKIQGEFTDEQAEQIILSGVKDKDTGKERMPSFKEKLSPDDIKDVIKAVRGFAGK